MTDKDLVLSVYPNAKVCYRWDRAKMIYISNNGYPLSVNYYSELQTWEAVATIIKQDMLAKFEH